MIFAEGSRQASALVRLYRMACNRSAGLFSGGLTRNILLFLWLPLIGLSYFGTLAIAAWFSPEVYNWRHQAISRLLYPGSDPEFHSIASLGIAFTGLMMIPLVGYIRTRLRGVSASMVDAGASAFGSGAIYLVLAGLIVSHPASGISPFPKLHEILARTAAFALGAGMLVLWGSAARGYFGSSKRAHQWRWLLVCWTLLTLPAFLIVILRLAAGARFDWSNPLYRALENRSLWHLGFWEWVGSAAVFLFLLSGALFLQDRADS